MTVPTRRGLLAGAAGLTVAPVVARAAVTTAAHPDAELLALAGRFIAHERLVQTMPCDAETDAEEAAQKAEQRRLLGHKHGLVMQMGELRATTADGIAARARCLAVHNADGAHSMDAPETTTGAAAAVAHAGRGGAGRGWSAGGCSVAGCGLAGGVRRVRRVGAAVFRTGGDWPAGSPEEDAAEEARSQIAVDQEPLVNRMCELRAVTREGMAARARSFALWVWI